MRALSFLAAAAVSAAFASPGARASLVSCSLLEAKAAVRQVRPHIPSLGNTPLLVTPAMVDEVICFGGRFVAITVASGGTAGDIGWLVLERAGPRFRLELARSGYKLGLVRVGGDVVDSQPVYRRNDPNCCPTGGFDHERWHWNGHRFVLVRSWHTRAYRP